MTAGKKNIKTSENINNKLRLALKSGKFTIGYNTTNKSLKEGECKMIIISNNCPSTKRLELEYLSMLNRCSIHHFYGNNSELGIACGKHYRCCCIGIIDPGDSDILQFLKK
jgi:large subunit ribosomal protein L30e